MNNKVIILTEQGDNVEATAPVIISASRSTDIPAFYAKWFFNRLAKGYCAWYNPFNQQKMYISSNPQLSSSASFLRLNVLSSLN